MKSSHMKISAISAITNIGVSAYRQKCHIGTPLLLVFLILIPFPEPSDSVSKGGTPLQQDSNLSARGLK